MVVAQKIWYDGPYRNHRTDLSLNTPAVQSAITSIFLVVFTSATRAIKTTKRSSNFFRSKLRKPVSRLIVSWLRWLERRGTGSGILLLSIIPRPPYFFRVCFELLKGLYLVGKLYADLFTSEVSDVGMTDNHYCVKNCAQYVRAWLTSYIRSYRCIGSLYPLLGAQFE